MIDFLSIALVSYVDMVAFRPKIGWGDAQPTHNNFLDKFGWISDRFSKATTISKNIEILRTLGCIGSILFCTGSNKISKNI